MGIMKDEGKKVDPLFPRLHISDVDKGGPRTPPRNKMAISQHFNVPSQDTQRCIYGSEPPVLPLSTDNRSRLVPSTLSYHDANYKRSTLSTFGRSCGETRLATRLESYHSSGINNLNISLTTVKQTVETTSCQTSCKTGHSKPQEVRTTRNNNTIVKKLEYDDDYSVSSFTFGRVPSLSKNVYQKQLKLTDKINNTSSKDICRKPTPCYISDRGRFSELRNEEVSPSTKRSTLRDEHEQMLHDPNNRLPLKRKGSQDNMVYEDDTKKIRSTFMGDYRKIDHEALSHHVNKSEEDHGSLHLGDAFISGFNINPEEVSQIIGPEKYSIARRNIIRQQRVFQAQLFELHRLMKVQKILAESPELLIRDGFYKLNKLPPEDMFPHLDHHKVDNETEKIYNPYLVDLLPPLPPPPTLNCCKQVQPPWCFLPQPPPGNQWLVPVRSPSEGLVYKPLVGPSPPPVGLMTPTSVDFLTSGYNIPISYQQGIGAFPSTSILTSYGFPAITKNICSPTIDDGLNYGKSTKTACNIESDLQGSSGSSSNERKKDELPLFPTTPMVRDSKEKHGFDERIKVIKVVPRNPKLASESAARIFQFIQKERIHNE